ncbi:MAG: L,D-transpeptidase [Alphaproteobacteria bacterium]|nr:L,D-transpeptidase [Alphaproteobacteria bacterium]
MHARFVRIALWGLAFLATTAAAQAQSMDPDGRYSGGQTSRRYEFLGGNSYVGAIRRSTVAAPGNYAPGTIIVNTSERRLYLIQDGGTALKYGIGVGRVGFTWAGTTSVVAKKEWPDWTPPSQMLKRRPDLPRHMKGGPENPLGARAMYLGASLYRIHGSNEPETIGQAVSSGCFRLLNDDVIDLYSRVKVGAKVVVMR